MGKHNKRRSPPSSDPSFSTSHTNTHSDTHKSMGVPSDLENNIIQSDTVENPFNDVSALKYADETAASIGHAASGSSTTPPVPVPPVSTVVSHGAWTLEWQRNNDVY